MSPATRMLHQSLLRLAKGACRAWETWLLAEIAAEAYGKPLNINETGTRPGNADPPPPLQKASRCECEASKVRESIGA